MQSEVGSGKELQTLYQRLERCLQREKKWRPRTYNTASVNNEVGAGERDDMVRWLAGLTKLFHLSPETLALSTAVLDTFLGSVKVGGKYLRLVTLACFYLSAKLVEESEQVPGTCELLRGSRTGHTVSELSRMELCVADKLRWDLLQPTALAFIHIFHAWQVRSLPHATRASPGRHLAALTLRLQLVLGHHGSAALRPCSLALALWSLDLEGLLTDWLAHTLVIVRLCQVDAQELIHCRELVCRTLQLERCTPPPLPAPPRACAAPRESYAAVLKRGLAASQSPDSAHPAKRRPLAEEDEDDLYLSIRRLYEDDTCATTCSQEVGACAPPLPAVITAH